MPRAAQQPLDLSKMIEIVRGVEIDEVPHRLLTPLAVDPVMVHECGIDPAEHTQSTSARDSK